MKRRDLLKASAAATALPAVTGAQQHAHEAAAKPAASAWQPSVLNPQQLDTVIALVDLIIPATDTPGAKQANVHRYIDLFLKDGPSVERDRFLTGLQWLENHTQRNHRASFTRLKPAEQTAMLQALDTAGDQGSLAEGHRFFRLVKSMTARFYYQTRTGQQELNKGGRVPKSFGCSHSQHG